MIRIAFIIPTMRMGGAEMQQLNIINGLRDSCEIKLYILKPFTDLVSLINNEKVEIEVFRIQSIFSIFQLLKLVISCIRYKPNIIHSHMYSANLISRFLKIVIPKSKVINHLHGLSPWLRGSKLIFDKLTKSLVDKFIVVSKKSFDLRMKREKYDLNRMVYIPNSVIFPKPHKIKNIDREKYVFGMACRLIPLKNIGSVLMMAKRLKNIADFKLVIAGDGPEKKMLKKIINDYALNLHVELIGYQSNMQEFYKSIDILLISSIIEDMPLSMIEAMYSGKPIISTKVGGIPYVLSDLPGNLLVDSFDIKGTEVIIHEHISHFNYYEVANKNQLFAIENFSNDVVCKTLLKVYHSLIT